MNRLWIAAVLSLSARIAWAQEPDEALRELGSKLAKTGASARLGELLATDWGLQAVKERLEFLVAIQTGRLERDAQGFYEDATFVRDPATGDLRIRPERRGAIEALAQRVAGAPRQMEDFGRRADELAQKIQGTGELNPRIKAAWADPEFRLAFFHRHWSELRTMAPNQVFESLFTKALERPPGGKPRLAPGFRSELMERVRGTYEKLDEIKQYDKAYRKAIGSAPESAARTALESDLAQIFLLGRILRQSQENSPHSIGGLTESENEDQRTVAFNLEPEDLLPGLRACQALALELGRIAEPIARELAGGGVEEADLSDFLKNERARVLVAEQILGAQEDQKSKADKIFEDLVADWFVSGAGGLAVKPGRFHPEGGQENTLEALENEIKSVSDEFGSTRSPFDQIAERLTEPEAIRIFENRRATFVLQEDIQRVIEGLSAAVRQEAVPIFIRAYLTKEGEGYAVRPERARRIEELVRRAQEIKKESQKEGADK